MDTLMELDDLKSAWQSLDARLAQQNGLAGFSVMPRDD